MFLCQKQEVLHGIIIQRHDQANDEENQVQDRNDDREVEWSFLGGCVVASESFQVDLSSDGQSWWQRPEVGRVEHHLEHKATVFGLSPPLNIKEYTISLVRLDLVAFNNSMCWQEVEGSNAGDGFHATCIIIAVGITAWKLGIAKPSYSQSKNHSLRSWRQIPIEYSPWLAARIEIWFGFLSQPDKRCCSRGRMPRRGSWRPSLESESS